MLRPGLLYRWQSDAFSTPTCRRPLSACPDVLLETANLRSILLVHAEPLIHQGVEPVLAETGQKPDAAVVRPCVFAENL